MFMVENLLHGKKKVQRGQVRHEIYDKTKERHRNAFKDLKVGSLESNKVGFETAMEHGLRNVLLQFYDGKPVGYSIFRSNKNFAKTMVDRIFVHPDYRDTIEIPMLSVAKFTAKVRTILRGRLYVDVGKNPRKSLTKQAENYLE